ncbi:MAG TPA: hypothetical protein DDY37_01780 [Legionella sp.]|nr:hypothetical protein [Legionella sp.]
MDFPCRFPIKIIGLNSPSFVTDIENITRTHYPDIHIDSIRKQHSPKKNYIAMTVTVDAQDQATLDALYLELTKHPDIKMVL